MKPVMSVRALAPLLAAGTLCGMSPVQADEFGDALARGKTSLELRYRYENVEQAGIAAEANASTLRTRLRYTSGEWQQSSLLLEMDNVSRIGDDRYNDTRNGKVQYPMVVDPDGTDLNQALVKYLGIANTPLTVGRQRINLDNQRFVGSVAWRQNEQTFDGTLLEYKGIDRFTATWAHLVRVNRIQGPDAGTPPPELEGNSDLLNLKYVTGEALTAVGYAYLLDFDNAAASSSRTLGLRLSGGVPAGAWRAGYAAEFARQSDHADNPVSYDADYLLLEGSVGRGPVEFQLGYEVLGSDGGTAALQTPLATGHRFQGWADKFLATPAAGVVDVYAGATAKLGAWGLALALHRYEADQGSADYGDELNAQVTRTFAKRYTLTAKYADYQADTFTTDTRKFWLMAEAKF